jgi:hypothetical protein
LVIEPITNQAQQQQLTKQQPQLQLPAVTSPTSSTGASAGIYVAQDYQVQFNKKYVKNFFLI